MGAKRCVMCKEVFPLTSFPVKSALRRSARCNQCDSLYNRDKYQRYRARKQGLEPAKPWQHRISNDKKIQLIMDDVFKGL